MLKRSTLLLLMAAIALGGGVLLFENFQGRRANEAGLNNGAEGDGELLFPFAEDAVESFVVTRPSDTLVFSKNEAGTWEMNKPKQGAAEGGAIAFLLSQLTSPATQTLTLETQDELPDFGLAESTITVDLIADGKPYQLMVGDGDFSGDKRYVRAIETPVSTDTETDVETNTETNASTDASNDTLTDTADTAADTTERLKIHVVPGGILNAVNRPTSDWLILEETSE